ncbi:hypothetical protein ACX16W_22890 [Bacillus cereus]
MEILMKSYEYRFRPVGHVYKAKVNSLAELQRLFSCFCSDDWKRAGEAYFKTEDDDKWLEYEEFILKYFKYQLRLPDLPEDLELVGFEDGNGMFKSNEEMRKEREAESAKNKAPSKEEWLAELISYRKEMEERIKELKEELENEEMAEES